MKQLQIEMNHTSLLIIERHFLLLTVEEEYYNLFMKCPYLQHTHILRDLAKLDKNKCAYKKEAKTEFFSYCKCKTRRKKQNKTKTNISNR